MAMAESHSSVLINNGRDGLAQDVLRNADQSEYIQELIRVDVPLTAKFREVNFCDILARNSESIDSLKKLIKGLNILEKYGKHLLKPEENRSDMWRHIKYNNTIYSSRVDNLQGGKEIMAIMGYTENRSDRVAFPDDAEPDNQKILNLIVDLILGKKELETYLNGNHPHPQFIEAYIGEDILSMVRSNSGDQPYEGRPMAPKIDQQTELEFQPETLPVLSMMETISMPQTVVPASNIGAAGPSLRGDHSDQHPVPQVMTNSDQYRMPQVMANSEQYPAPQVMANSDIAQQSEGPVTSESRQNVCAETTETLLDTEKVQSIACDICGDNRADVVCHQCDDKQLCKDCDVKWHKHPKRQNHRVDRLRPSSTEDETLTNPPNTTPGTSTAYLTHGPNTGSPSSQHTFIQQQTWQEYQQQQQQPQQPGYQPQHRPAYDVPQNYPEFPRNHMAPFQQQQQYFTQRSPFSLQPPAHTGDRVPHREGLTMMYNPVSGQQYELSSVLQSQPYQLQSHQQHFPTMQDQTLPTDRHQQFLLKGPNHNTAGHMMQPNQSNYPNRYMSTGPVYGLMSTAGRFDQNIHSTMNYNQGVNYGRSSPAPHPSTASTPSPMTPMVSPLSNTSGETNYISSRSAMSSQSDKIPTDHHSHMPFVSKLLPKIKAIPDFEKRRSRLEIDLLNLREDVSEWDREINAIIVHYPNFFQNEQYVALNKKKRNHLHEIKELECYLKELEETIAEIAREQDARQVQTYRELAYQRMEELRRLSQGSGPPNFPDQRLTDSKGPVFHGDQQRDVLEQVQTGPDNTVYEQGVFSPGPVVSAGDPLDLNVSSLENSENEGSGLPEDIRRMLVLDQSPFPKPVKSNHSNQPIKSNQPIQFNQPVQTNQPVLPMNVPVEPKRTSIDVAYPPDVSAINDVNKVLNTSIPPQNIPTTSTNKPLGQIHSGHSAPDLQHVQHPTPPTRSVSEAGAHQWECQHCTFLNDSTAKACSMCFKTSDNPKIVYPASDKPATEGEFINCQQCTFLNKKGYTVCEMCGQKPKQARAKEIKQVGQESSQPPVVEIKQVEVPKQVAKSDKPAHRGLDDIIKNDQDQVYLEKKAAQEQFEKMHLIQNHPSGTNKAGNQPSVTKLGNQSSGANWNENQSSGSSGLHTLEETQPVTATSVQATLTVQEKNISGPSKYESGGTPESTGSYVTARNSPTSVHDDTEQQKVLPKHDVSGHTPPQKGFKGSSDFTKTIEQINLKRDQEQMNIDGKELITYIKEAENSDFDMEEIKIALQHCRQDDMKPTQWLKEKWLSMVKLVEDSSAELGKKDGMNHVGDISREEARDALLHCNGEIDKAVKKCVEDRQKKYQHITEYGEYGHEDILTALLQNHGDLDEAFDQLNQSSIKTYLDRIWGMRNNQLERLAHMNTDASRVDVCNSVVGDEDFQSVIKDTAVDKYRRIRMVFVEGKLRSWGRAELVISILEQNILQSDDPLECTLEDIIDAVRNCRDRKSSLVYLKQECGICFSFYPMSKIRNLTVCNCKLCEACLKQCFEIAVREKFVRNWGCPICSAPGLENDDTRAADYFDFLHLLLERLVSKEVIELFDTKLRDWHLQKELNFRWCAHCAFGFLWDRPETLGMTCPSCKKKTCYSCKIKWEDQHQGLTCEQFNQWKIDNDPEKQAKGVKLYLEENGIDCPSCKMRYSLAKGGCMHFRCPQCGYEFCSGCSQAFLQQGVCKLLESCKNKGLHCHHPRDCYYYLRDNDVGELQKLLKKFPVEYNTEIPHTQEDRQHCPLMEQKEFGIMKKDEACGKNVQKGYAGLCEMHYKEYLVGLINKNKIDPVTILKLNDLKILIERNEKVSPELRANETEAQYRSRLIQFIKENFKLQR